MKPGHISLEEWCKSTNNEEILQEYNRGGNQRSASEICRSSNKKVTWKCKHGHTWEAPVNNRTAKKIRRCPVCGHRKLVSGVNDFGTLFPEIAKEWDYQKNYPKTPSDVFPGNNTTWYWWKCNLGHSYRAKLNNKTSPANQTKCPYCSNSKVLPGFNDLETWCKKNSFDTLIKEYSPDNRHKMREILYGHDSKVKWICSVCGHHYSSNVYYRTKGTGCPECNKAKRSSLPEQAIFYYIKKLYPDAVNSYNDIFNNTMEIDVYIPSLRLGIEYDGVAWHASEKSRQREQKKYRICKSNKIRLIRVREGEEEKGLKTICDDYILTCFSGRNYTELDRVIYEIIEKIGNDRISVCCEKDLIQIIDGYIHKKIEHNLLSDYPEIAKEWDYDNNGGLTPEKIKAHSGRSVWWRCSCGHPSYRKTVYERTGEKFGCPYCSGRLPIPGETDILTLFPNVCKDWDYEKNKKIDIQQIKPGSQQKVWWKCSYCGKEWRQDPNRKINRKRVDIAGCTECRHRHLKKNSL